MNICLVHEEYPEETNFGGIATYQKTLAEELVRNGNSVYVICRGIEKNQEYIENGVHIFRIFVNKTNNQIKDYTKYRKMVATKLKQLQEADLIDIIEVPDWGAETVLFEPIRQVPLVVRLHTPLKVWLKYNQNNFGKVTNKMLAWEEKMLMSADYVTCCSQALKRLIEKEFKLKKEIIVTPNPANIVDFYYDEKIKKEDKLLFVGSLEERKGVLVLAKALNIIFKKYPNLKIEFIGKDTNRNSYNISTKEVVKKIVNKRYHPNIIFVGQIPNSELNKYFNSSTVGIFPSLFDNFPYVVLESMATGLHIVGSQNSGMVEMLEDDTSIYDTGNYQDLAKKIIRKYELSKKEKIDKNNIKRVKEEYNANKIVKELLIIYNTVIKKYNIEKTSLRELSAIVKKNLNLQLKSYKKEKDGVANKVYLIKTQKDNYIIKKYLYNYDFNLSSKLYKIYNNNGIDVIEPINPKPINYKNIQYNIFEYKKATHLSKKISNEYLKKIVCCKNRKINKVNDYSSVITEKCEKYYNYLNNLGKQSFKTPKSEMNLVLNTYRGLRTMKILDEKYLNHGDISAQNIIKSFDKLYLIDFDEACIAPRLYDFAVIVIKIFTKNDKFNKKEFMQFKESISNEYKDYTESDYINIIKYYLCKILLEKFYFYENDKIDILSSEQLKDNYKQYLRLLTDLQETLWN